MPLNTDLIHSLLSVFTAIFQSDLLKALTRALLDRWRSAWFTGTYTVQKHESTLELKDSKGRIAVYTKHQQMTFIQDNVFAIQDQAWGDGNIFADYRCSPGVAADRYREGYRYKILISLRATRNKGDQETLWIERKIEDGFTTAAGNFQTQVDHPTRELVVSIIFPKSRRPEQVILIQQDLNKRIRLGQDQMQTLPDGRVRYSWQTPKPRLFEGYILRWEW